MTPRKVTLRKEYWTVRLLAGLMVQFISSDI